jgi:hypothetical protein
MRFAKGSNAKKLAKGIAGHFIFSLNQFVKFDVSMYRKLHDRRKSGSAKMRAQ